ncbi:hypothetical protein PIB30_018006 [Stylosanthes scabra]|uniref:Cytochrome c-552/DMSO reductase-like haem-binding domain-containing protein n=1 Tax=Stylosanthes scabra TaxID=79078 RepID=A0ABU6V6S8_9FABA|nr:hypothetical protein [Stylosanthes scabra]
MAREVFVVLVFASLGSFLFGRVDSHQESGPWSCESNSEIRVEAEFRPGVVTLDGHGDEWKDIGYSQFPLLPALDPDADKEFKAGKMTVKSLHDGHDIFFLVQVDSDYAYSKGEGNKCPSVALMFQIGEGATYHRMGGCSQDSTSCTNKNCKGHEVDIMHFSIGNAIPGRLYGGNPLDNGKGNGDDRFGHLVDLYSWNPHCRYLDGTGPSGSANDSSAQNDWKGAWWHSSFTVHSGFVEDESPYSENGKKGTYIFEFSRPLRTMDHLQQDVQFTIGATSMMSVAFWYPENGQPWHGSGHYSIGCDWIPIDISIGGSLHGSSGSAGSSTSWSIASAFSLVLSVAALCVSVFVTYRVFNHNNVPFTPMVSMNNL